MAIPGDCQCLPRYHSQAEKYRFPGRPRDAGSEFHRSDAAGCGRASHPSGKRARGNYPPRYRRPFDSRGGGNPGLFGGDGPIADLLSPLEDREAIMTCREYEPLIALYVEGDLNDRCVEQHVTECSCCRELLEDLRASQASLKELVLVDAAFLSAVRSGVLGKIENHSQRAWPLVLAFAIAVALILAIPVQRKPAAIGGADPPVRGRPPGRPAATAQAIPRAKKSRPGGRPRTRGSAPLEPLVVKMLTDDPNIVIIWLVDRTGD